MPFRFTLGGGTQATLCFRHVLSGTALVQELFIPQLAEGFWAPNLPPLELLEGAPETQNVTEYFPDSPLDVVPKLPYVLGRC